jgi:hypothetical protein
MTNHDAWSRREEPESGQDSTGADWEHGLKDDLHRSADPGDLPVELADVGVEILASDLLLVLVRFESRLGPSREAANEVEEVIFELDEPFLHVFRVFFDTFRFL